MTAITVEPRRPETTRLEDIPTPEAPGGSVLVDAIAVGVEIEEGIESGGKPEIVCAPGTGYRGALSGIGFQPEFIIEWKGVGQVIVDSSQTVAPGGEVCLTRVGIGGHTITLPEADTASNVVLRDEVVVGGVNGNKWHRFKAAKLLFRTDLTCLAHLVTRCEPPAEFKRALAPQPDYIKVFVQLAKA